MQAEMFRRGPREHKFAHADKDQLIALSIGYREALETHSPYDIQIDLDVPRIINGHVLFRTRHGLVLSHWGLIMHAERKWHQATIIIPR
jgi:hypothetical protein